MHSLVVGICVWLFLAGVWAPAPPEKKARLEPNTSNCVVMINEVAVDFDGTGFIELRRQCKVAKPGRKSDTALKNYKLLLMEEESMKMIFVADFSRKEFKFSDVENHFVLGTSTHFGYPGLLVDGVTSIANKQNRFPVSQTKVYWIALVHKVNKQFKDFVLQRRPHIGYEPRQMDKALRDNLRDSLVDLAQLCIGSNCDQSVTYLNEIGNPSWVQVYPHHLYPTTDITWSFCGASVIPFNPRSFEIAQETPGRPNLCSTPGPQPPPNTARPPVLPEKVPTVVQDSQPLGSPVTVAPVCRVADFDQVTSSGTRRSLLVKFQKAGHSRSDVIGTDATGKMTKRHVWPKLLPRLRSFKREVFKDEWHISCKNSFVNGGEILKRDYVRSWLVVDTSNNRCKLNCQVCKTFFELGFRPDLKKSRERELFTGIGFVTRENQCVNTNAVVNHGNHQVHQLAQYFFENLEKQTRADDIEKLLLDYDSSEFSVYLPTIRIMALVLAEIRSDTSFRSHANFIEALSAMHVDVGSHHSYGVAAKAMTTVITNEFHRILLSSLIKSQKPFSLICDASTDTTNNALFAILLQTIEGNRVVIYFYRLIKLHYGESAVGLSRALIETVNQDNDIVPGFEEYFWGNIVGYASDNAKNMIGRKESLLVKVRDKALSFVYNSTCSAHKLELVQKHAFDAKANPEMEVFGEFDRTCNKLHSYYMSRGSKRWDRLTAKAEQMGKPLLRLKHRFDVRWASSTYEVLRGVHQDIDVILHDLQETAVPVTAEQKRGSDKATRSSAYGLLRLVKMKSFRLILCEYLDLMEIFKKLSLKFEESASTLLGKGSMLSESLATLERRKFEVGPFVREFLATAECVSVCTTTCTLVQYTQCEHDLKVGDLKLIPDSVNLVPLRAALYERLLLETYRYFNQTELEALEIFNLKKWNFPSSTENRNALINEILVPKRTETVCKMLGFILENCSNFVAEFRHFLNAVFSSASYMQLVATDQLETFWAKVAADTRTHPQITVAIQKVLSLPFSSADAERVFSYMTKVKNRERSSLTPETLERIIRIKFNGAKSITDYDLLYYIRIFLKNHVRSDAVSPRNNEEIPQAQTENPIPGSDLF